MTVTDILSPECLTDPVPVWEALRETDPLSFHEGMNAYVISRYDDVERAFKDPVFTSDNYGWQLEPVHGRTILQMDGREHSIHRRLVTPAFKGSELTTKFVPVIRRNSRELLDAFRDDGEVELVDAFTTRFPINVIVDMLGLPKSDHDLFRRWYTSIIGFLSNLTQDETVAANGMRTRDELEAYMLPRIAERRAEPRDDLLSLLGTAEIDGERMSDLQVKAFVSLLLVAGGETTDKALASMMLNLVRDPDQMAKVRADRSLIGNALAETLRHSPPVQMIMRQPSEDVELSGGTVPKGATVICLIAAANRDPRRYSDPDRFDVSRPDLDFGKAYTAAANHTGFALGRHFCVGAMLARTEVEIAANDLLDAMEDIELAATPVLQGLFTRAPSKLRLRFRPAN
ncbi:pulcherriminic acid synthase [Actinoplanes campanulatus]|uniref:Pulcherriminic acid synthase n=1 Tax=Actinoplanes campanulatus TaxID=113559 RepID=A0A7W5FGX1_9ACTN|nr:cytochrome P450 [Actinoplanes campanulatus]MBB3098063.1 pulcherriminic acid synthase [Actinoplanes campanulatus]GGN32167.1 cytochrome P450 [Actinoplanes campanulatus]GID40066.1 cytochrome P450 [Actinoplanes campanulatus]